MKKLDVSAISDISQMFIKKGTLQFLQDMNTEVFSALIIALIGFENYNTNTVYVLYGCKNTGTGNSYTISEGAVFYQGEVFLVDAASFTISGNVALFSLVVTQYEQDADPVVFSDNVSRNVHNIRKASIIAGTSGSGMCDYSAASFLNFSIPKKVILTGAGVSAPVVTDTTETYTIDRNDPLHRILKTGYVNIGDVGSGEVSIPVTFSPAIDTDQYIVVFTQLNQNTGNTANCFVVVQSETRTTTGFTFKVRENQSGPTQNLGIDYIIFAK